MLSIHPQKSGTRNVERLSRPDMVHVTNAVDAGDAPRTDTISVRDARQRVPTPDDVIGATPTITRPTAAPPTRNVKPLPGIDAVRVRQLVGGRNRPGIHTITAPDGKERLAMPHRVPGPAARGNRLGSQQHQQPNQK